MGWYTRIYNLTRKESSKENYKYGIVEDEIEDILKNNGWSSDDILTIDADEYGELSPKVVHQPDHLFIFYQASEVSVASGFSSPGIIIYNSLTNETKIIEEPMHYQEWLKEEK